MRCSAAISGGQSSRSTFVTTTLFPDSSASLMLVTTFHSWPSGFFPEVMIPIRLYALILGGAGALLAAYLLVRRKPKSLDEVERARREWLDRVGRITDGTVIDVQEMQPDGRKPATFLIFQYDVAGVSYEASQDVTYLRQLINLHSCRLGLPTSVRYDPQNPGNSIVLSERWMGLRQ
jgi:uncharacterized protein DUF3592